MKVLFVLTLVPSAMSQIAWYDATGKHPECAEGSTQYMQDCVMKSNWFAYVRMAQPTVVNKTCKELGYEIIGPDAVFDHFDMYWKGGPAGFKKDAGAYLPFHSDLMTRMSKIRDGNPACKTAGEYKTVSLPGLSGLSGLPGLSGLSSLSGPLTARITWYDATGDHPECAEGPTQYMQDCVMKSNWFAYISMSQPTVVNKTCKELGYEVVGPDPVFSHFDMYWKGGPPAFKAVAATYLPAHPDLMTRMSRIRDDNPACKIDRQAEILV